MAKRAAKNKAKNGGANPGFESTLWAAADELRNKMDAAEYKHVVLGLIFLKYISDAFEERHNALIALKAEGATTPRIRSRTNSTYDLPAALATTCVRTTSKPSCFLCSSLALPST